MCDGRTGGETWLGALSGGARTETPWEMWRKNGQRCSSGRATTRGRRSSKTPAERISPSRSCPQSTWNRAKPLETSPGLLSLLIGMLRILQHLQIHSHGNSLPALQVEQVPDTAQIQISEDLAKHGAPPLEKDPATAGGHRECPLGIQGP